MRHLERVAQALLERETLDRDDVAALLTEVEPVSDFSHQIGVEAPPQLLPALRAEPADIELAEQHAIDLPD